MSTYTVCALWENGQWTITVPDLPGVFSMARRLDQVAANAREAISLMTDVDEAAVGIDVITWSVSDEDETSAARLARAAAELRRRSLDLESELNDRTRDAVEALRRDGFSYRDIGRMLGISYQRVQQLASSERREAREPASRAGDVEIRPEKPAHAA